MIKVTIKLNTKKIPRFSGDSVDKLNKSLLAYDLASRPMVKIEVETSDCNLYEIKQRGLVSIGSPLVIVQTPPRGIVFINMIASAVQNFLNENQIGSGAEIQFDYTSREQVWIEVNGESICANLK